MQSHGGLAEAENFEVEIPSYQDLLAELLEQSKPQKIEVLIKLFVF